jgi:hypothetical protein
MIEVAPEELQTNLLKWDEAWLYCITLTHDNKYNWRMPTSQDAKQDSRAVMSWIDYGDNDNDFSQILNQLCKNTEEFHTQLIIPVRDI